MLQPDDLRVRANIYRLLGGMFLRELSRELLEILRAGETWEIFSDLAPALNLEPLRRVVAGEELSLDEVRLEFHRLFSVPTGPYVFPYESCYSVPEPPGPLMGPATAAVVNAYGEAGFAVATEFLDAPDHIGAELRFVAELLDRQAQALDDADSGAAELAQSQRLKFCDEHLGQWVQKIANRISASGVSPFYAGVAALAAALVTAERTLTATPA